MRNIRQVATPEQGVAELDRLSGAWIPEEGLRHRKIFEEVGGSRDKGLEA